MCSRKRQHCCTYFRRKHMAEPTVSPGASGHLQQPAYIQWIRRIGASMARPVFAVILAMLVGAIVIIITTPGALDERITVAISAYQALFQGSFGDPQSLSQTLVRVGPLIFTSLSVALA